VVFSAPLPRTARKTEGTIDRKTMNKTPDCGHFSKDGLEYVVTRPDTPRPFDNMLWNKQLLGNVQQTGAGYTDYQIGSFEMTKLSQGIGRICDFDVYGRDTFLNRLVYVRDNKTGKFWNVGWEPVKAKPTRFRARHGLGYTVIENTTDGIDASFRVFVPAGDEPAEYWTLRLRPLPEPDGRMVERSHGRMVGPSDHQTIRPSDRSRAEARDLTVFVYEQISFKYMWGFNSYGDMFYRNSRLDAKRNMAIFTKHPFVTPHPWQTGYLAADRKIDCFDGSKDFFVGTYNQLNEPEAVVKGRCTGSVGSSDATIAA
jgi:cellobiose phosphorylase